MENMYIYVLPFIGAIVILLIMLLSNVSLLYTVKAGKADKYCFAKKPGGLKNPHEIEINGNIEDVSSLNPMLVCGDSMQEYDVRDGNTILVQELSEKEKCEISTHPILVFSIVGKEKSLKEKCDSHYKLRKFIKYIDNPRSADWEKVYNELPTDMQKMPVAEFSKICANKANKICDCDANSRYVLSETYLCDAKKNDYSFHPISTIYAKVCYHV